MMSPTDLATRYRELRARSLALVEPLSAEDHMVQAFAYASPAKWHLAHTTWFFETFVSRPFCDWTEARDWGRLFNSYYEGLGQPHPQALRGILSRPSLKEVLGYRRRVDDAILATLERQCNAGTPSAMQEMLCLGIAHEEQHQELILTDMLANFSLHPDAPSILGELKIASADPGSGQWLEIDKSTVEIGARSGFCFDHELPSHDCIVQPFAIAKDLVRNAAMLSFIEEGGYARPEFWLSAGMAWVREQGRVHPRYWRKRDSGWVQWTLYGEQPIDPHAPLCHVSGYEAEALASFLGARLPTEVEWEHAAKQCRGPEAAQWVGQGPVMPVQAQDCFFGGVWNWTRSAYLPYPGFRPREGAVGEYNGKFMSDGWVLRGGSCASVPGHLRASYRNFFAPAHTWQYSGLRLARDL